MRKIGIFAAGAIGKFALEKLVENYPESMHALVVLDHEYLNDIDHLPVNCDVRKWTKSDEHAVVEWLFSRDLDLILLAWWPHIITGAALDAAPVILNTHPSLLPYCRGKDPNFWAIVERAPFGVTLHHVDAGIDSGDIAFQKTIPISWSDSGGSLYEKASEGMRNLIEEALPTIVHGEVPRSPQGAGGSIHYRRDLEPASFIDLDKPTTARDLLDLLRARTFPPHPACRFIADGDTYEVRVNISKTD